MTISDVKDLLASVPGFEAAVAFRAFPEGETPALPFITFSDIDAYAFRADNVNYYSAPRFVVELHERVRNPATELLVEAKLTAAGITFSRAISYDATARAWLVAYTFTTKGE